MPSAREISRGLAKKETLTSIAARLGRSVSTISREVERNATAAGYRAHRADRNDSRLRHIKVGARHAGTRVLMLVAGLDVRIVSEDGELLRELTLDPSRIYQPMGRRWNDVPRHV